MAVGRSFRYFNRVYRYKYRGAASKKATHRMLQCLHKGKWIDQWHDWEKRPFTYRIDLVTDRYDGGGNF